MLYFCHKRSEFKKKPCDFAEEELYQNYKENALHNDSDEDPDSKEPKPDNNIVVQYRPIRTSWSQLSVVRHNTHRHSSSLCSSSYILNPFCILECGCVVLEC